MSSPFLPSRWLITGVGIDTADDPDVFPFLAGQSFLINKGPSHRTKINQAVSGRERRRALWSAPVWRFRLSYEYLRDDAALLELQRILAFYNNHSGSAVGFFYYDRDDHSVAGQRFGTGDGSTTTFQLKRTITIGGISYAEPIYGLAATPTIYVNGSATGAFTIGELGQITFSSAPASSAALTWDGSFFFMCRFDNDELDIGQIAKGLWQNGGLDFRTFKP